ncbi:MAG: nucleoside recognition domain-containing protein [Hyphomicrobiales bacterium]
MSIMINFSRKTREALDVYWILARITIPITIGAEVLNRLGAIEAISPLFSPVMGMLGLPAELGLAWLTAMVVGIWGAIPLLFTLVPIATLSTADVTIFSALILFAHALPIEQKIIAKAGPSFLVTTMLRIVGGLLFGLVLHHLFTMTGWLAAPVNPVWIPISETLAWKDFFFALAEAMAWMLVILVVLFWALELLKLVGAMDILLTALSPILRLAGIEREASYLTSVGLFLGISYGSGILINEAESGNISPRQVFLSCIFMGFAHSIIEDTLIVVALGADIYSVLIGRLLFAIIATALIAAFLQRISDTAFFTAAFSAKGKR